jgi:hypothetical protein
MKQEWTPQELVDHWMLTDMEMILINKHHADSNKLGFALLLKYFQREGKFPQRKKIFRVLLLNTLPTSFI